MKARMTATLAVRGGGSGLRPKPAEAPSWWHQWWYMHWYSGTLEQWYIGALVQCTIGTVVQLCSGTLGHWYILVHWYIIGTGSGGTRGQRSAKVSSM